MLKIGDNLTVYDIKEGDEEGTAYVVLTDDNGGHYGLEVDADQAELEPEDGEEEED